MMHMYENVIIKPVMLYTKSKKRINNNKNRTMKNFSK